MNKTSSHISLGLTLLLLFCLFLVLNIYSPLLVDDYLLQFKISPLQCTDEPIKTFHELLTNMWNHRYVYNGRMSNNLAMLLLYTVGKDGFNILNSLVIILSLCGVCILTLGKVTFRNILASCALAILLLPCVPRTIFWLAGACNYLWVVPFICGILFYLEKYFNNQRLSSTHAIILLGCIFIASSMHEASGVILCGMTVLSILCQHRRKESTKLLWCVLFVSIIGTSIPLGAPGIWHRASVESTDTLTFLLHIIPNLTPHCWFSLSLLLIYLNKKGIHTLFSPKGFYLLSGIACTLLFGSYGAWGGGYFYLNLSILIFILPGAVSLLNKKRTLALPLTSLIILYTTITQLFELSKFNHIIEEENKKASEDKIFPIDIPLADYNSSYIKQGTSCLESVVSQKQYSIIQEVPQHRVVFNTLDFDKGIYSKFPSNMINEPVVVKVKDLCLIRLPKGEEPIEDSLNIENSGTNSDMGQCFLFRKYTSWEKFLVKRKQNRNLSLYSIDYQNGFFYIILPTPACYYHELTCSVALPDESKQELHIDLDRDPILNTDDKHLN